MSKRVQRNPFDEAGFFSRCIFSWITPIMKLGYSRTLEPSDVPPVPDAFSADVVMKSFEEQWQEEMVLHGPQATAARVMFRAFRKEIFLSALCFIPYAGIVLVQPYFVSDILSFLAGADDRYFAIKSGIVIAVVFGVISLLGVFSASMSYYLVSSAGFKMKVATIAGVFAKSMRLSAASRNQHTVGQKVSLISADAERIWTGIFFIHWLWAGPFMMVIALALLVNKVKVAGAIAFVVMLIITIAQIWIGKNVGGLRGQQMKFTDERTKVINESLQGIRILKFYSWESATAHRIEHIRSQEVNILAKYQLLKMLISFLWFAGPLVVAYTLFMVYMRLGGDLTVANVYTIYALLNVVRLPLSLMPMAFAAWMEARVALNRLTEFLLLEEIEEQEETTGPPLEGAPLISIKDADFAWDRTSESPALQDVNLDIFQGDFIAIVGSVGSGKTSLVSAILGQMILNRGSLQTHNCRIAYVAQEHWICNTSVTNNVTFNSSLHDDQYASAIDHSQLTSDLLVLPNADHTSIGERGLNLSGGQKARVSIARALYAGNNLPLKFPKTMEIPVGDAESEALPPVQVYIFDDALASVDVHVGKAVFNHAICAPHIVNTARIVCLSSNYHLLPRFQKVVVMKEGRIAMVGDFDSVVKMFPEYDAVGKSAGANDVGTDAADERVEVIDIDESHAAAPAKEAVEAANVTVAVDVVEGTEQEASSSEHTHRGALFAEKREEILARRANASAITTLEDRAIGAVGMATYVAYFSFALGYFRRGLASGNSKDSTINTNFRVEDNQIVAEVAADGAVSSTALPDAPTSSWQDTWLGAIVTVSLLVLFAFCQGARVVCDLWLGYWAQDRQGIAEYDYSDDFYRNYFIVLTWGTVLVSLVRAVSFILICLGSSYNLHTTLLTKVLNAPVNLYYDVTPMGRILNRFTKDLDNMDCMLPDIFLTTAINVFYILSVIIVCLTSSAWLILLFFPLFVLFYFVQSFFRTSSRELKRLDNISRSPMYSMFGETLQGMVTIKALHLTEIVKHQFNHLVDQHLSNWFIFWFASRWLALRLDVISNLVSFFVAILAVILKETNSSTNSNLIGVALVYSLQLTGLLQWTVRTLIDTEANMTSVERLLVFRNITPENVITKNYEGPGAPALGSIGSGPVLVSSVDMESCEPGLQLGKTSSHAKGDYAAVPAPAPALASHVVEIRSCPLSVLQSWPQKGQIEIKNLFLRYRPGLPYVLNGLDMSLPGGAKVGICGRTAAGKSSLMQALFRIVEPEAGSDILIDGINIQSVPLHVLRSQVTIIPQDPFMFSGTLRENLDPFKQYTESDVFEALNRVQLLEDVMTKFPLKLEHPIAERGENISVGQRQLVCIARALLRKSKVIVMDEATASVDSVTDAKIQRAIREEFKHCTVLTIAHRLDTIADYDLIVVMAHGKMAEMGTPLELLEDVPAGSEANSPKRGLFQGFVDELGAERKAAFMEIVRSRAHR